MNRGYITPKNGIALRGDVTLALVQQIEARQATPKRLVAITSDLELEHDGKRYHGSATASSMGDVQWDIDSVTDVATPKASKSAPKKAATTAAAKKAAPSKAAGKKAAKGKGK